MGKLRLGKHQTFLASGLLVALWSAILLCTRSVFSGYHFIDDHQILIIKSGLGRSGFWETLSAQTSHDLTFRFRPIYMIHRVLETAAFGDNLVLWSLYTLVLAILTSLCLFWFARKIGLSTWVAAAFPLLALMGDQSTIWWRLGPNETIGMFVLSVSLLFLGLYHVKGKRLYKWFFVLFAALASLSKESFVILIPALMFALTWVDAARKGGWRRSARENLAPLLILLTIACVETLAVILYVGTDDIGYAGLSGMSVGGVLRAGLRLLWADFYFAAVLVLSVVALWTASHRPDRMKALTRHVPSLVLLALIIGPQLFLYAKTGVGERYVLPGALGVALLIVSLYRSLAHDKRRWVRFVAVASVALLLCFQLYSTTTKSLAFATEGIETNKLLTAVVADADSTTPILIVAEPADDFETLLSFKRYMTYRQGGKGDFYLDLHPKHVYTGHLKGKVLLPLDWYNHQTLDQVPDKKLLQRVLIFQGLEQAFLDRNAAGWFEPNAFSREVFYLPGQTVVLYSR